MSQQDTIGEILDKIDMEAWLSREAIDYKVTRGARGVQLNVKECPCCGNSNWKVYLNQDTGLGNCFHGDCEAKFSKWSFIKAALGSGLNNKEVVEHCKAVAAEQGWRPKVVSATAAQEPGELRLPKSMPLPIKGHNLKYLDARGIDLATAKFFGLRYCHEGGFAYTDPESGLRRWQKYDRRIIIPIYDLEGDLVSYQGRDITGKSDKKYLFPPGFASTGAYIYNGQNAYGCVDACMGEGAFDVFSIHAALSQDDTLRNVASIGSFGKHLSSGNDGKSQLDELLKLRDRGLKRLTFMWDGENRAILDAIKAALLVRRYGIVTRVAILPTDKDPNEVPAQVVRQAYWNATTINDMSASVLSLKYRV